MEPQRDRLPLSRVELDWLVTALHGGWEQQGYLDPATGQVHLGFDGAGPLGADGEEVDLDDVDWVAVDHVGSRPQYEDMADFAGAVADPVLAVRLQRALQGRGAFRRFREAMDDAPEQLRAQWSAVREARCRCRAVEWLLEVELVDEREGREFVARQEQLVTQTLECVQARPGPVRVDVAEVPARWAEVRRVVADGSTVLLTEHGAPWGVVEPWSE